MAEPYLQEPEFFDWRGILIRQDEQVHKVGTDAVLLGSWGPSILPFAKEILDAGTGTGILSLMMARCYPLSTVRAIDVDDHAIQLTADNINQANLLGRVEVVHDDILEDTYDHHRFDLVICNPPYYLEQMYPHEKLKQRAKHIPTTIADWMQGLSVRAKESGHIMLIVPSSNANSWIEAANEIALYNLDRLDVYSFEEDPAPKRTLLHLARRLVKPNFSRLVIYQSDKSYTSEYLQLTGIRPSNAQEK